MADTYENYLLDLGYEIKHEALEAKNRRDASPEDSPERHFHNGELLAMYRVISVMQQQANAFGIQLADLRLDDINPERDLT